MRVVTTLNLIKNELQDGLLCILNASLPGHGTVLLFLICGVLAGHIHIQLLV